MLNLFGHAYRWFYCLCDFLHCYQGFAVFNVLLLTVNVLFIWTLRRCKQRCRALQIHTHKLTRKSLPRSHGRGSRSPLIYTWRSGLLMSHTGRRKHSSHGKTGCQMEGGMVPSSEFVTANDNSRHADKSTHSTDGNDETLDEVTWGFDASGSPVIARHYGKWRARAKGIPVDVGGGDNGGKKTRVPASKKAEWESRKKKNRLMKERMFAERALKEKLKYQKPQQVRSAPQKLPKRRKNLDPRQRDSSTMETNSLVKVDKGGKHDPGEEDSLCRAKGRASAELEGVDGPGWAARQSLNVHKKRVPPRRHSSDLELYKHRKSDTGCSDLEAPDNRSETSLVCKRDSWIWFSPETRPSVENFASRQRKFHSEDPRVAALAAEIRRQEELNRDIERTAESLIDSSSLSSKNMLKVAWEASSKSEWSCGKHRLSRSRARDRMAPYVRPDRMSIYVRPQDRYMTRVPSLLAPHSIQPSRSRQLLSKAGSGPGPKASPRQSNWHSNPSRRGGRQHRAPALASGRKVDRESQTSSPFFFSPIGQECVALMAVVPSSGSSSSGSFSPPQVRAVSMLSPRSQPIFYYNSPSAEIIKHSAPPGRYSPIYESSTLMASRNCSPAGIEDHVMRVIETRSTQTTQQSHTERKDGAVSHRHTHQQADSSPEHAQPPNLVHAKLRKHWARSLPRERQSERHATKGATSNRQPGAVTDRGKDKGEPGVPGVPGAKAAVTLRAVRDSNSPSGFRAVIDVKSPPASQAKVNTAHPGAFGQKSDLFMSMGARGGHPDHQLGVAGNRVTSRTMGSPRGAGDSATEQLSPRARGVPSQPAAKTNSQTSLNQYDAVKSHWRKSPTMTLSTGDSESESYYKDKPSADTSFRQVLISKEVNTTIHKLLFDTEQSSSSLSPSTKLKKVMGSKQSANQDNTAANIQSLSSQHKLPDQEITTPSRQSIPLSQGADGTHTIQVGQRAEAAKPATPGKTTEAAQQPSPRLSSSRDRADRAKRTNIYTRDYYLGKRVAMKKQQESVKKPCESPQEDIMCRWKKFDPRTPRVSRMCTPTSRTPSLIYASDELFSDNKYTYSYDVSKPGEKNQRMPLADIYRHGEAGVDEKASLHRLPGSEGAMQNATSQELNLRLDSSSETEAPQVSGYNETDVGHEVNPLINQAGKGLGNQSLDLQARHPRGGPSQGGQGMSSQQLTPYTPEHETAHPGHMYEYADPGLGSDTSAHHRDKVTLHRCDAPGDAMNRVPFPNLPIQLSTSTITMLGSRKRALIAGQSGKHEGSGSTNNSSSNLPYSFLPGTHLRPSPQPSCLSQTLPSPGTAHIPHPDTLMPLAKDPHIDILDHLQLYDEPFHYRSAKNTNTTLHLMTPSALTFSEDISNTTGFRPQKCPSCWRPATFTLQHTGNTNTVKARQEVTDHYQRFQSCVVSSSGVKSVTSSPGRTREDVLACNLQLPPTSSDEEDTSAESQGRAGKVVQLESSCHQVQASSNPDSGYDESMSDRPHQDPRHTLDCPVSSQGHLGAGVGQSNILQAASGQAVSMCRSGSLSSDVSHSSEDLAHRSRSSSHGQSEHDTLASITDDGLQSTEDTAQCQARVSMLAVGSAIATPRETSRCELVKQDRDGLWLNTVTCMSLTSCPCTGDHVRIQPQGDKLTTDKLTTQADFSSLNQHVLQLPPHLGVTIGRGEFHTREHSGRGETAQGRDFLSSPSRPQVDTHSHGQTRLLETSCSNSSGAIVTVGNQLSLNMSSETSEQGVIPLVVHLSPDSQAYTFPSDHKRSLTQGTDSTGLVESCSGRNRWSQYRDVFSYLGQVVGRHLDTGSNINEQEHATISELPIQTPGTDREKTGSSLDSFSSTTCCSLSLDIHNCALEPSSPLSIRDVHLCLSDGVSISSSPFPSLLAKPTEEAIELHTSLSKATDPPSTRSSHSTEGPAVDTCHSGLTTLSSSEFGSDDNLCCDRAAGTNQAAQGEAQTERNWRLEEPVSFPHPLSQKEVTNSHGDTDTKALAAHTVCLPPTSSDEENENMLEQHSDMTSAMPASRECDNLATSCQREAFQPKHLEASSTLAFPATVPCTTSHNNLALATFMPAKRMVTFDIKSLTEAQKRAMIPARSVEFVDLLKRF